MIFPPSLGLVFDLLIIILLAVTIFYSMKLSQLSQLFKRIQNDRQDMELLLEKLSNIIDKAHSAIQGMKDVATENGSELQKSIDEAKTLADELEIMLNSGNNLAGRLDDLAGPSGDLLKTETSSRELKESDVSAASAKKKTKKKKTPAEKMLFDAIGENKERKK